MQMKLLRTTNVDFDVRDQRLIRFSTFDRYCGKKWEYNGTVHQPFTDIKKAHDSVKSEVLYSILTESGISKKLAGLIKMSIMKPTVQSVQAKICPTSFVLRRA
jgi:hypothetical protein